MLKHEQQPKLVAVTFEGDTEPSFWETMYDFIDWVADLHKPHRILTIVYYENGTLKFMDRDDLNEAIQQREHSRESEREHIRQESRSDIFV